MQKVTFDQASKVSDILAEQIGEKDWISSIAVIHDSLAGFVVEVGVDPDYDGPIIFDRNPVQEHGVGVRMVPQKPARALGGS